MLATKQNEIKTKQHKYFHVTSDVYTRNPASFILQRETKHTKNSDLW